LHYSAYAPQPNWGFNADTNSGHAFGIFYARYWYPPAYRLPVPVNQALGPLN